MAIFHPAFPLKICASKAQAAKMLGCSSIFVFFAALTAFGMLTHLSLIETPKQWFELVVMILGVPLFGVGMVMAVMRMIDKRPVLEVDDRGITSTYANYGLIEWKDIALLRTAEMQASLTTKLRFLVIVPKNFEALAARLDPKAQKRARNSMKQWNGIAIPMQGLPFRSEDVLGAVCEYGTQMILEKAPPPPVMPV